MVKQTTVFAVVLGMLITNLISIFGLLDLLLWWQINTFSTQPHIKPAALFVLDFVSHRSNKLLDLSIFWKRGWMYYNRLQPWLTISNLLLDRRAEPENVKLSRTRVKSVGCLGWILIEQQIWMIILPDSWLSYDKYYNMICCISGSR